MTKFSFSSNLFAPSVFRGKDQVKENVIFNLVSSHDEARVTKVVAKRERSRICETIDSKNFRNSLWC